MGLLYILWHNCNALHVDCTEFGVFQEANQIMLQSQDGTHLEAVCTIGSTQLEGTGQHFSLREFTQHFLPATTG